MCVIARHPFCDVLKINDTIIAKKGDKIFWSKNYKISMNGGHYFSGNLLILRHRQNCSIVISILTGDEILLPFSILGITKRKDGGYLILRKG